jgi:hypothetical protein
MVGKSIDLQEQLSWDLASFRDEGERTEPVFSVRKATDLRMDAAFNKATPYRQLP